VALVGIPLTLGVIETLIDSMNLFQSPGSAKQRGLPVKLSLILPTSSYSICRPLWLVVAPQLFWQPSSVGRGSSRCHADRSGQ
jgi:hypothetical protein